MFCERLYFVYCMLWLHVPLDNSIVFHVISPTLYTHDMVYPVHSKLKNHTQLCPSVYTYDMVYPIHSKLRNHTQLSSLSYTYDRKNYLCLTQLLRIDGIKGTCCVYACSWCTQVQLSVVDMLQAYYTSF
jgi:hypothetical protein